MRQIPADPSDKPHYIISLIVIAELLFIEFIKRNMILS